MKFRGRMTDPTPIRKFHNILSTMAKLSKVCVMRLTVDKIYFILTENSNGGPSVWCDMDQSHFFHEYNMEGVTRDEPEIFLELEPERLAKTLGTLKSYNMAKWLKIKLTRKHLSPCLSFEIELSSSITNSSTSATNMPTPRICVHDVPVNLIPRRLWPDYREPEMQAFDVSLYLPDLKQIKHLAEKFKNLGSHFTIHANRQGNLKMSLDTDQMKVVTHFKNLEIPRFDDTVASAMQSRLQQSQLAREGEDDETFTSVRIELKRFNLFLSADQLNPKRIVANFHGKKMMHLFLIHDYVCIQYFIPAEHE